MRVEAPHESTWAGNQIPLNFTGPVAHWDGIDVFDNRIIYEIDACESVVIKTIVIFHKFSSVPTPAIGKTHM